MAFVATEATRKFYASEDAVWARAQLEMLVSDCNYNTPAEPFYVHMPKEDTVSFVGQHMTYLCEHQKISVQNYLSNLRLKTRIR